jgi:GNAT superfamily N-acetyltransferase
MMQRNSTPVPSRSARRRGLDELAAIHDALQPTLEVDPARLTIRSLVAEDRPALDAMARRCSDDTLRRRFHSSLGPLQRARVVDLLRGRAVDALVATTAAGDVVGLATAQRTRTGVVELAVLVEDAHQSAGLGHRLTAELLDRVRSLGYSVAVADVLRQPSFVLDGLVRHHRRATVDLDGPVATVRIPLEAAAAGRLPGMAVT